MFKCVVYPHPIYNYLLLNNCEDVNINIITEDSGNIFGAFEFKSITSRLFMHIKSRGPTNPHASHLALQASTDIFYHAP